MSNIEKLYKIKFDAALKRAAEDLANYLAEILSSVERIDRIGARAKTPDRFLAKAFKRLEDGSPKYSDPLNQIQDQVGARVIVFYLSDLEVIREKILENLKAIEITVKEPERDDAFGYSGEHFILLFPDEIVPDNQEAELYPKFFELQVKTLFQHAWSEAHHDLGYKSIRELTSQERRQIAFSAAQAWGADQVFLSLSKTLIPAPDNDQ